MSMMLVAGKIFHCIDCGESVRIEYTDGAKITQVGDPVVDQQSALIEHYGQPVSDPEQTGYYLCDEVVCASCYAKNNHDGQAAEAILAAIERFDQVVLQVADSVRAAIANPTLDDLVEFIGKPGFDELSGHSMLPARKQRKLNELFQIWHCTDRFIETRIDEALAAMPKPWHDEEVQQLVEHIADQIGGTDLPVFTRWSIQDAENINPYIQSEFTVRFPESNTPAIEVYRPRVIHLDDVMEEVCMSTDVVLSALRDDQKVLTMAFKKMAHTHFLGISEGMLPLSH